MATCPRCVITVPAFERCDRCGLVLGFEGLTVLLNEDGSAAFRRACRTASRQASFARFREENGREYVRVTYSLSDLKQFAELVSAGQGVKEKRLFLNGMEIPFPQADEQLNVPRELLARTRASAVHAPISH
jgi:hypothetical protein